jgi:archaellum component FlaC
MLQNSINSIRNQPPPAAPVSQSNFDDNLIRQMLERIANLENELLALKDEFANWSKQLMDDMRLKADIETVKALE